MGDTRESKWARRILILLGGLFAFTCGFNFSFNHWYVDGPLLLDAGWHSGVIFHRGWNPQTLLIEYPADRAFFTFHLSPFMSFFGVLSAAFPGDRALYYCIVQGLVYAPFGAAAVTMLPARMKASEAALAMLSGVCVMFSGQLLACIGYPHLEPFVPAAIAMMLAAMLNGNARAAAIWLVLCATLREDAGFHAASFAFAALACNVTKRPFPLATRTLVKLTGLAFALSVLVFVAQKKLWPGPGLFREEYLGEPTFAHVTAAEMSHRMSELIDRCGFIYVPVVATIAIAVVRRDPRYLFGFIVELPWLLINLFAKQPSKARFELYTGFPFIASAFWVLIYSHVDVKTAKDPLPHAVLRRWSPFLLVSIASTIIAWRQGGWVPGVIHSELARGSTNRRGIEALANRLRANPNPTAHTRVDLAVAAWTTESMDWHQVAQGELPNGLAGATEFYFFRQGFDAGRYPVWLAHEPALASCGGLRGTQVRWCGRGALPPDFFPMSPMLERAALAGGVTTTDAGALVLPASAHDDTVFWLGLYGITPGDYRATWSYDATRCKPDDAGGVFEVAHNDWIVAHERANPRGSAITLTFHVAPKKKAADLEGWVLRASAWPCAVTLTDVRFVVESPDDLPRIADANVRAGDGPEPLNALAPTLAAIANGGTGTRIDPALATWARISVPKDEEIDAARGLAGASSVYFFSQGAFAQRMLGWIAREPALAACGALRGTEVRWCGAGELPRGFTPSSPFLERASWWQERVQKSHEPIEMPKSEGSPPLYAWGPFAPLLPGEYTATWSYRANGCAPDAGGTFDVSQDGGRVAEARGTPGARSVSATFRVAPMTENWEFRAFGWPCPVTIDALNVTPARPL